MKHRNRILPSNRRVTQQGEGDPQGLFIVTLSGAALSSSRVQNDRFDSSDFEQALSNM